MMNEVLRLVLIPLVVTILGSIIYGLISRRKKDYKITCEQLSLRQYKEKESDNIKISISYKNEKVGESLSVMTVRLTNNGKKDVSFRQVFEDKIQIKLKKAEILDVQIEGQSEKVAATVEKTDSMGWLLSWGILKKKEIIVLKVVSICNNDKGNEPVDSSDLEFVFRGNNLNKIEPISSQRDRALLWALVVASVLLMATTAVIPLRSTVRYDVVVDGQCLQGADVSYNAYTKQFVIKQAKTPSIKSTEIQRISVSKQQTLSTETIVFGIIMLVYIVLTIVYFIVLKRKRKLNWLFSFLLDR